MKKKILLLSFVIIFITSLTFQKLIAQSWLITGNNNTTALSKLGTTNFIPLSLYTNNKERIRIDELGRIGIGTSAPVNILTVKLSGSTPAGVWLNGGSLPAFLAFGENMSTGSNLATASNIFNHRPVLNARRARGTLAAPLVVANNDFLSSFVASGFDGNDFQNSATIDFYVDGTPSSGNVPARISFVTGSNISNRLERLKVGSTGNISFNNNQLFIQQQDGNIGIGTTLPKTKLDVQNPDNYFGISVNNSYLGLEDHVGILLSSVNAPGYGFGAQAFGGYYGLYAEGSGTDYEGLTTGVSGIASGSSGSRIGVRGYALGGENAYGVYGTTLDATSFAAAGYFNGDVWATSFNVLSDRKFKTDITPLNNSLSLLKRLKPSSYSFKKSEYQHMGLPAGKQLGLIADEVKEVFPEVVKEAVQPAEYDKNKKLLAASIKYESVNYTALIPVLIASIQEQQKQIEHLEEMVKQLVNDKEAKTNLNSVTLDQNNPNPVEGFTTIHYSLPAGSKNASLAVTDITGKVVKQSLLGSLTNGNISFNTTGFASGSYTYSIIIDGRIVKSKKMIVGGTARQ